MKHNMQTTHQKQSTTALANRKILNTACDVVNKNIQLYLKYARKKPFLKHCANMLNRACIK